MRQLVGLALPCIIAPMAYSRESVEKSTRTFFLSCSEVIMESLWSFLPESLNSPCGTISIANFRNAASIAATSGIDHRCCQ